MAQAVKFDGGFGLDSSRIYIHDIVENKPEMAGTSQQYK